MSSNTLNGLKVAILVTDGFEQVEMVEPRKALDEAGAATSIVSPKINQVRGWNFTDWGARISGRPHARQGQPAGLRRTAFARWRH